MRNVLAVALSFSPRSIHALKEYLPVTSDGSGYEDGLNVVNERANVRPNAQASESLPARTPSDLITVLIRNLWFWSLTPFWSVGNRSMTGAEAWERQVGSAA